MATKRQPKYLKNLVSIYIGGFPYAIRVRPGKETHKFLRELRHCKIGDSGECATCANSHAGMDAKIAPFMAFSDSRAIGVHKFRKVRHGKVTAYYGDGVIYEHDQGKFQKEYDENRDKLLKSSEAVGWVTLRPYRMQKTGSGPNGKRSKDMPISEKGIRPFRESVRSRRGSLRRAQRSGILPKSETA